MSLMGFSGAISAFSPLIACTAGAIAPRSAVVNDILGAKGLLLRTGTVVDATLIAAPSSIKNADGQRDPEMKQTKKGNQ